MTTTNNIGGVGDKVVLLVWSLDEEISLHKLMVNDETLCVLVETNDYIRDIFYEASGSIPLGNHLIDYALRKSTSKEGMASAKFVMEDLGLDENILGCWVDTKMEGLKHNLSGEFTLIQTGISFA